MSVNVNRNVSDQFYRYKMPRLIAKVPQRLVLVWMLYEYDSFSYFCVVVLRTDIQLEKIKKDFSPCQFHLIGGRQREWNQDGHCQHGWCCKGTEQASNL